MSGALKLVAVLGIIGGVAAALLVEGAPLWMRGVYVFSALVGSLPFFGIAEALDRLEQIQTIVGRPSK